MKILKKFVSILLVLILICSMFVMTAGAAGSIAYGAGTVSASLLNIRSGPGLGYYIVSQVKDDEIVVILEKTSSEWYKINYNGTVGYVSSAYLTNVLTAENFNAAGSVSGSSVRYRSTPSTSGAILGTLSTGATVRVIGINSGWYKLDLSGTYCYMRSDYIDIVSGSSGGTSYSATGDSALGVEIANYALQYVGYPYVYGAESPSDGFDCSGLAYYVYKQYGYSLSRTASAQYRNNGVSVSKSELQAGDLVFFSTDGSSVSHVGIYIGDGLFVHASTSKTGVIVSELSSTYYTRGWFGAKRIV